MSDSNRALTAQDFGRCEHGLPKWACGQHDPANTWEAKERAKIEAEILERKRQREARAVFARQQEERASLTSLLEKAVADDDTAQEIELRLRLARLDKSATPVAAQTSIPIGSNDDPFHAARTRLRSNAPAEPEGHGRLAYFGYNVLAGVILLALSALHPVLGVAAALPLHFWNVRQRLRHIGWDSSGGITLLWMVGFCVPLLNLVLGLTLLFTAGKDKGSA
jgi:hypothetical protein